MQKNSKNVYWILGGIPKKGDKFKLSKNATIDLILGDGKL